MSQPRKCVTTYTEAEAATLIEAIDVGREVLDMPDAREAQVLAEILRRGLDEVEGPTCNHLPEYRLTIGDETVCMRCRDEEVRQDERDLAEGVTGFRKSA